MTYTNFLRRVLFVVWPVGHMERNLIKGAETVPSIPVKPIGSQTSVSLRHPHGIASYYQIEIYPMSLIGCPATIHRYLLIAKEVEADLPVTRMPTICILLLMVHCLTMKAHPTITHHSGRHL